MSLSRSISSALLVLGLFLAGHAKCIAAPQESGGLKLVAQLIWGTDQTKPASPELKPVAPEIEKRLRRVFKWHNYWEVNRKSFEATPTEPAKIDMSRECRIEVSNPSRNEAEIQLFGKGKLVV